MGLEFFIGQICILLIYNFVCSILLFFESDMPPVPEIISVTWEESGKKSTLRWFIFYYMPYVWKVSYKAVFKIGLLSVLGIGILNYYMTQSPMGQQLAINTGTFILDFVKIKLFIFFYIIFP
jgi:hypothetical protein